MPAIAEVPDGLYPLFDKILQKKNDPSQFEDFKLPDQPNSPEDLAILRIDPADLHFEEYIRLSAEKFLDTILTGTDFRIFYHFEHGDEWQKVLRVFQGDSARDVVLAMNGGDSEAYHLSSAFFPDYTFRQYAVYQQTITDLQDTMSYHFDSVITTYSFDEKFRFSLLSRDTFSYEESIITLPNQRPQYKTKTAPISFHGMNISAVVTYSKETTGVVSYTVQLQDQTTGRDLLSTRPDWTTTELLPSVRRGIGEFMDVNFDGYTDFVVFCHSCSGSMGNFYMAYLFDPVNRTFTLSELLSGSLERDSISRTITDYKQSGGQYRSMVTRHFNKAGTEIFTERTEWERIAGDPAGRYLRTYQKISNQEIIVTRSDTVELAD